MGRRPQIHANSLQDLPIAVSSDFNRLEHDDIGRAGAPFPGRLDRRRCGSRGSPFRLRLPSKETHPTLSRAQSVCDRRKKSLSICFHFLPRFEGFQGDTPREGEKVLFLAPLFRPCTRGLAASKRGRGLPVRCGNGQPPRSSAKRLGRPVDEARSRLIAQRSAQAAARATAGGAEFGRIGHREAFFPRTDIEHNNTPVNNFCS